jgi:hypothetical protein
MAIGFTPIIPMNPVQPNPDARFQRFGTNESHLFGKPLLADFVAPKAPNSPVQLPTVTSPPATQAPVHQPAVGNPWLGDSTVAKASMSSPGYSGQVGNRSGVQMTPQLGSKLDIKA